MRILVSVSGMVRLVVLCFVLGIVVGVYFGVGGAPDVAPPAPAGTTSHVDPLAVPRP